LRNWESLTSNDSLKDARIQAHYVLQIAASAPTSLNSPAPDWSHTAFEYDAQRRMFVGAALEGLESTENVRPAFLLSNLEVALLSSYERNSSLAMGGHSIEEGLQWLRSALAYPESSKIKLPEYPDFPEHELASGQPVTAAAEVCRQLDSFFYNSSLLLQDLRSRYDGASPVRVWPHHFDMATLITVREPSEPGGEDGVSVGAGLSPGDPVSDGPYWYVTPWPYPDAKQLPGLSAGSWNADGWVGALLPASELPSAGDSQKDAVQAFFDEAVEASIKLLAG